MEMLTMLGEDVLSFLAMVIVQIGHVGMNTTSKIAMDSGMKPLVIIAYRQIFASLAMIPFVYFFEWKTTLKITKRILFEIFLCSVTGLVFAVCVFPALPRIIGNQVLFFIGLQRTTLTVATTLINTLPAITFILAVLFRQETVIIKKKSGQRKVLGTVLCVGGAMLLTFYHGPIIPLGESHIRLKHENENESSHGDNKSDILGPLVVMASIISWASWYIIQAEVNKKFAAPYTSIMLMNFMGIFECAFISICADHKKNEWSLLSPIRLVAALYAGVVYSALGFALTSWTIQRKGAVYASIFSPLGLVIAAIAGWTLLHDKIYTGTIIGWFLIITGLYVVVWGKKMEAKDNLEQNEEKQPIKPSAKQDKIDHEFQSTAK